jgi:hypothetical protein
MQPEVAAGPQQPLGPVALALLLRLALELVEYAATDARLAMRKAGQEVPTTAYTPTPIDLRRSAEFARRGPSNLTFLEKRRPFLEAEVVSALAASRGSWQRRGTSRERRPQARRTRRLVASRDGPSRSSDDPPLARLRGFAAASARMVVHLERRRAAMRLA